MLSQNVTASKAMPHPRIKTSSSLKFPLFTYQITTSPTSPIRTSVTEPCHNPLLFLHVAATVLPTAQLALAL